MTSQMYHQYKIGGLCCFSSKLIKMYTKKRGFVHIKVVATNFLLFKIQEKRYIFTLTLMSQPSPSGQIHF